MDFNQCKLTKNEWNSIEIPITTNEKYVCELIIRGFNNVNITLNRNISLISFLKIKPTNNFPLLKIQLKIYLFKWLCKDAYSPSYEG